MRKSLMILPALGVAAVVAAVALPAVAETRTYSLDGFEKVSASAGVEVILKQGPYAISVNEPKGKFDKLKLEVKGDTLIVSRQNSSGFWGNNADFTVTVTAPAYTGVSASSGSDVEGERLSLRDLDISVSSGASIELDGSCTVMKVSVSSGGDFDGEDLKCETASISASSGADADAFATVKASGDASSGGSITFHGNPQTFQKETSSGGSVRAS
jgi:hypothetical protein